MSASSTDTHTQWPLVHRYDYRRDEHKTNRTNKFGRAIQQRGYSSFAFEILEKVRFSERQELYDLEDEYITKYDSINNGFNSRRNERQEA